MEDLLAIQVHNLLGVVSSHAHVHWQAIPPAILVSCCLGALAQIWAPSEFLISECKVLQGQRVCHELSQALR